MSADREPPSRLSPPQSPPLSLAPTPTRTPACTPARSPSTGPPHAPGSPPSTLSPAQAPSSFPPGSLFRSLRLSVGSPTADDRGMRAAAPMGPGAAGGSASLPRSPVAAVRGETAPPPALSAPAAPTAPQPASAASAAPSAPQPASAASAAPSAPQPALAAPAAPPGPPSDMPSPSARVASPGPPSSAAPSPLRRSGSPAPFFSAALSPPRCGPSDEGADNDGGSSLRSSADYAPSETGDCFSADRGALAAPEPGGREGGIDARSLADRMLLQRQAFGARRTRCDAVVVDEEEEEDDEDDGRGLRPGRKKGTLGRLGGALSSVGALAMQLGDARSRGIAAGAATHATGASPTPALCAEEGALPPARYAQDSALAPARYASTLADDRSRDSAATRDACLGAQADVSTSSARPPASAPLLAALTAHRLDLSPRSASPEPRQQQPYRLDDAPALGAVRAPRDLGFFAPSIAPPRDPSCFAALSAPPRDPSCFAALSAPPRDPSCFAALSAPPRDAPPGAPPAAGDLAALLPAASLAPSFHPCSRHGVPLPVELARLSSDRSSVDWLRLTSPGSRRSGPAGTSDDGTAGSATVLWLDSPATGVDPSFEADPRMAYLGVSREREPDAGGRAAGGQGDAAAEGGCGDERARAAVESPIDAGHAAAAAAPTDDAGRLAKGASAPAAAVSLLVPPAPGFRAQQVSGSHSSSVPLPTPVPRHLQVSGLRAASPVAAPFSAAPLGARDASPPPAARKALSSTSTRASPTGHLSLTLSASSQGPSSSYRGSDISDERGPARSGEDAGGWRAWPGGARPAGPAPSASFRDAAPPSRAFPRADGRDAPSPGRSGAAGPEGPSAGRPPPPDGVLPAIHLRPADAPASPSPSGDAAMHVDVGEGVEDVQGGRPSGAKAASGGSSPEPARPAAASPPEPVRVAPRVGGSPSSELEAAGRLAPATAVSGMVKGESAPDLGRAGSGAAPRVGGRASSAPSTGTTSPSRSPCGAAAATAAASAPQPEPSRGAFAPPPAAPGSELEEMLACLGSCELAEFAWRGRLAALLASRRDVARARRVAASWMLEVAEELTLHEETICLACAIFDARLAAPPGPPQRSRLQLAAVAAILVASKREEETHPCVADLAELGAGCFDADDVRREEIELLAALGYALPSATTHAFLSAYKPLAGLSPRSVALACYICALAHVELPLRAISDAEASGGTGEGPGHGASAGPGGNPGHGASAGLGGCSGHGAPSARPASPTVPLSRARCCALSPSRVAAAAALAAAAHMGQATRSTKAALCEASGQPLASLAADALSLLELQAAAAGPLRAGHPVLAIVDKFRSARWLGAAAVAPFRTPPKALVECLGR